MNFKIKICDYIDLSTLYEKISDKRVNILCFYDLKNDIISYFLKFESVSITEMTQRRNLIQKNLEQGLKLKLNFSEDEDLEKNFLIFENFKNMMKFNIAFLPFRMINNKNIPEFYIYYLNIKWNLISSNIWKEIKEYINSSELNFFFYIYEKKKDKIDLNCLVFTKNSESYLKFIEFYKEYYRRGIFKTQELEFDDFIALLKKEPLKKSLSLTKSSFNSLIVNADDKNPQFSKDNHKNLASSLKIKLKFILDNNSVNYRMISNEIYIDSLKIAIILMENLNIEVLIQFLEEKYMLFEKIVIITIDEIYFEIQSKTSIKKLKKCILLTEAMLNQMETFLHPVETELLQKM
jgi:hypothetical protein